jgi:hypothetical protein
MVTRPTTPPPDPPRFTLNRPAYEVAKAKRGLRFDQTVAAELGVHPVTWSRILSGQYPLVEAKARRIREVFPDDYDAIVTEVIPDAATVVAD